MTKLSQENYVPIYLQSLADYVVDYKCKSIDYV